MKIEHGIPPPDRVGGKPLSYPWPEMKPGDSVLLDVAKCGASGHRASRSFSDWSLRNGRRDLILTCRTIAPGKVRVWVLKKEGRK